MALINLPQAKWASGTGRQVILKSDFHTIEQALVESFALQDSPALEYLDAATVRVNATPDCQARVMFSGFPSPLHQGLWITGDLSDGRYRENAMPASLNLATTGSLWGTEKPNQWYAVFAVAGPADTTFSLKAMPLMRVSSQSTQIITLRNNANTSNIGYGFTTNELVGAKILLLTGTSRGLTRPITANNNDNDTGGTITYGGSALSLAQGDWFVVLPKTNFRYLGAIFNDAASNLVPFRQKGRLVAFRTPRELASGAINGYTLFDLWAVAPPTARLLQGYVAATHGYDVKLAFSDDGLNPVLIVHGAPPSGNFQGVRGAIPFVCHPLATHTLYLNNDNTANQIVNITGWEE